MAKKELKKDLKIVWAVNPFQDGSEIRNKTAAFLKSLGRSAGSITPVYISSPVELQVLLEFSVPAQIRYREITEKSLKKYMKPVTGLALRPAHILEEPSPGLASAAKKMAQHVRKEKADVLIAGTHARKGILRFALGSYAETLLSFSETPVVLVSPQARVSQKIRKIVFATDFSAASRKAFLVLMRFARSVGAAIEIMHAIQCPKHWATSYGYLMVGTRAMTPDAYLAYLKEAAWKKANDWALMAKKSGVKASVRVEDSTHRAADILLKAATSSKADMIALASQSSRLRSGLMGSVARDILRGARVPVWILRAVS